MTTKPPARLNHIGAMQTQLNTQMDAVREAAHADIQALDALITQKTEVELPEVEGSVCLEDAAALIEEHLRARLGKSRADFDRNTSLARDVSAHGEINSLMSGKVWSETRKNRLDLIGAYTGVNDVLVMLLNDEQIKALALAAAKKSGALPLAKGGRKADEAVSAYNALIHEIAELHAARAELASAVGQLIEVKPYGWTPPAPPNTTPHVDKPVTISVMGKDGQMHEQLKAPVTF